MRQKSTTSKRRPYRPKLSREHYAIYFFIARTLGRVKANPARGDFAPEMSAETEAEAKDCITRLCTLAGVICGRNLARSYDDALKAVYMRERAAEKGFDPAPAYRLVERVRELLGPVDAEMDRKKREWLVENVPGWAAYYGVKREPEPKGGRLDALHDALGRLLTEGDAGNESAVFRLRRAIYDLEHPPAAGDWNDWSAWEEGGES